MPQVLGFDISVEVEGKKLPEYQPEVTHDETLGVPVTTCWIPSEAGKVLFCLVHATGVKMIDGAWKEFSVVVEPPPAPRPKIWSLQSKLDGMRVDLDFNTFGQEEQATERFKHCRVSADFVRPFLFSKIQLTGTQRIFTFC
jgi:hypothetical protein